MAKRRKILLVDDSPDLLSLYSEVLARLPSKPQIATATSASRAMAMLESDGYRLLICDLKMPKVDGLQLLSIVRRKYPELRTIAFTAVPDEQFRSRAYALGVDLFWHKPATEQETQMFLDCVESLLGQERDSGFRGVQSKSLADIIQLECISQSSSVLRITNGDLTGRIWIQDGELIDAHTGDANGEAAVRKILGWRAGTFEMLPCEPARARSIFKSYSGLLLEFAQALDESRGAEDHAAPFVVDPLAWGQISKVAGIEFLLAIRQRPLETPGAKPRQTLSRGLENPERMGAWSQATWERFRLLGDKLQVGVVERIEGLGPQRHVALTARGDTEFCVGWGSALDLEGVRAGMKQVLGLWAS